MDQRAPKYTNLFRKCTVDIGRYAYFILKQ